jgi:hypothetical protein
MVKKKYLFVEIHQWLDFLLNPTMHDFLFFYFLIFLGCYISSNEGQIT